MYDEESACNPAASPAARRSLNSTIRSRPGFDIDFITCRSISGGSADRDRNHRAARRFAAAGRTTGSRISARTQCLSNLKNLSLAIANYATTHSMLPAMGRNIYNTYDDNGVIVLNWVTSILPEIEAALASLALQARIDAGTLDAVLQDIPEFYLENYPRWSTSLSVGVGCALTINDYTGQLNYRACLET